MTEKQQDERARREPLSTMDNTIVFKVTQGAKTAVHTDWRNALSDVENLLDRAEPGSEPITVSCDTMTKEQIDELDEFDGW